MTRCYIQIIRDDFTIYLPHSIFPGGNYYFKVGEIYEAGYADATSDGALWKICLPIIDYTNITSHKEYKTVCVNDPAFTIAKGELSMNGLLINKYIIDVTTALDREKKLKEVLS